MKFFKSNYKNKIKILISMLIVVISIILFIVAINKEEQKAYAYNINLNNDYKVYLNNNEFIEKEYIEKNNIYISEMVKNINLDISYNYNATDLTNIKYKYDVIETLYIDYMNTNQNLIKKQNYIIKDKYLEKNNANKININEKINLDYNFYNGEVNKFKERYNLQIKAYIRVSFIINTEVELEKSTNKINKEAASEININLNQPVFEITEKYYGNESNKISKTGKEIKEINTRLLVMGVILFILGIIYFIIQMRTILLSKKKLNIIKLNKILKKYSDIIVELKDSIYIDKYFIIDVKEFKELIDVEEEIREPILFFEEDNIKTFIIIDNEKIYRYIFYLE